MHLSPTTVYFVLQLDSIRHGVTLTCGLSAGLLAVIRFVAWMNFDVAVGESEKKDCKVALDKAPSLIKVVILTACACLLWAIIPATNTAAAMVIAPAIVNSTVLQSDIPELYSLGVNRLKESLTPQKPSSIEPTK